MVWLGVASLWLVASSSLVAQKPKLQPKIPDIQGTWNLVSWERNGKKLELTKVQLFITDSTIFTRDVALPDDNGWNSWRYGLATGDKPNTANMTLTGAQERDLLPGICSVEGGTLKIVLAKVTRTAGLPLAEVKVDRPMALTTVPGSDQLLLVLKRAAAEDDPISHLRKLGGSATITLGTGITLDSERAMDHDLAIIKKFPVIHTLDLRRCGITDAGLVHLKDMADLQYLLLADMPITDKGLVHLERLPKLTYLRVKCAKVSGAGLRGFTRLEELWLEDSAFTDAGLAHLQGLTQLKCLNLRHTQITDAGLVYLKQMTCLNRLFLENTKVTDAGLEHLRGLTRLRELGIQGTKVTDQGFRALKAAIPRLELFR